MRGASQKRSKKDARALRCGGLIRTRAARAAARTEAGRTIGGAVSITFLETSADRLATLARGIVITRCVFRFPDETRPENGVVIQINVIVGRIRVEQIARWIQHDRARPGEADWEV